MLAGGKQQVYQGTTLRKPFFFLLVDSVFGSFLGAAVCESAWELPLAGACAVWDACAVLVEAASGDGIGAVEFAVVASAAGEVVGAGNEAFAAALAVAPPVGSMV